MTESTDLIYETTVSDVDLCYEIIADAKPALSPVKTTCHNCNSVAKEAQQHSFHWAQGSQFPWIRKLESEIHLAVHNYSTLFPHSELGQFNVQLGYLPFNVQFYDKGEGYPMWHSEHGSGPDYSYRHLVWMLYLNDVPDGGTEFLYQNRTISAEKGKMVIWPAFFTHTHRGVVSHTREKQIATGWLHRRI